MGEVLWDQLMCHRIVDGARSPTGRLDWRASPINTATYLGTGYCLAWVRVRGIEGCGLGLGFGDTACAIHCGKSSR